MAKNTLLLETTVNKICRYVSLPEGYDKSRLEDTIMYELSGLIKATLKSISKRAYITEDMMGYANMYALRALRDYRLDRGTQYSTYLYWWLIKGWKMYIKNDMGLPSKLQQTAAIVYDAILNDRELDTLGLTEHEVNQALSVMRVNSPIDLFEFGESLAEASGTADIDMKIDINSLIDKHLTDEEAHIMRCIAAGYTIPMLCKMLKSPQKDIKNTYDRAVNRLARHMQQLD